MAWRLGHAYGYPECLSGRAFDPNEFGKVDARALKQAPSLRYQDGELVRVSDKDYRTYSAAVRCYAAEVILCSIGRGGRCPRGRARPHWLACLLPNRGLRATSGRL